MGWDYPGLSRQRAHIAPIVANAPQNPRSGQTTWLLSCAQMALLQRLFLLV
jgi:hypothetical protein